MSDLGRPRRETRGVGVGRRKGADGSTLKALSEARKGGSKRSEQFEVKKAQLALVDEDELARQDPEEAERLRARRGRNDFLVDEYGMPIPCDLDDLNANLGDTFEAFDQAEDLDGSMHDERDSDEENLLRRGASTQRRGTPSKAKGLKGKKSSVATPDATGSRKRKANPASPPGPDAATLPKRARDNILNFARLTPKSESQTTHSISSLFASASAAAATAATPASKVPSISNNSGSNSSGSNSSGGTDLESLLNELRSDPLDYRTSSSSVIARLRGPGNTHKSKKSHNTGAYSFFDEPSEAKPQESKPKAAAPAPAPVATPAPVSAPDPASVGEEPSLFGDDDDDLLFAEAAAQVEAQRAQAKPKHLAPAVPATPRWAQRIESSNEDDALLNCLAATSSSKALKAEDQEALMAMMVDVEAEEKALAAKSNDDSWVPFYFLDACEERAMPGSVFLFGKVFRHDIKRWESCCVLVTEVLRQLWVYPRQGHQEGEGFLKLCSEWQTELRTKLGIRDLKLKKVTRRFAWDHGLHHQARAADAEDDELLDDADSQPYKTKSNPRADRPPIGEPATWLKVHYSFKDEEVPQSLVHNGGKTFSTILGAGSSALELLLLKKRIMGPCWLQVQLPNVGKTASGLPPRESHKSWCKQEWAVPFTNVRVAPEQDEAPRLVSLSLSVRHLFPDTHQGKRSTVPEVVMVSGVIQNNVGLDLHKPFPTNGILPNFTLVRRLDARFPRDFNDALKQNKFENRVTVVESEKALLEALLKHIEANDPDILVGHDLVASDIDLLLRRMGHHGVANWSKLGRLHRSQMPKMTNNGFGQHAGGKKNNGKDSVTLPSWFQKSVVSGRLVCDTAVCARELVRERSYSLTELAKTQLGASREELDDEDVAQYFINGSRGLIYFLRHNLCDAILALRLMDKLMIMTLFKQLTNISGNLMSRSLMGGRAERIEYLLLHEFYNLKFVLPDKADRKVNEAILNANANARDPVIAASQPPASQPSQSQASQQSQAATQDVSSKKSASARRKPKYDGGLVLTPVVGLHDKLVLLLDFVSLYPSIIREFNVCFTTFKRDRFTASGDLVIPAEPAGVLPALVASLVQRRRTVKSLLGEIKGNSPAEQEKRHQLDIKQRAIKLTANSLYGCLGFVNSRFFCLPLAEFITRKGRENLKETKAIVEQSAPRELNLSTGLEVIYGDTDSIMIKTGCETYREALALGAKIKALINKKYKSMEIEVECVFKTLLLRTKKKYAALKMLPTSGPEDPIPTKETKGLDLVRRDWCDLSKDVGHAVLDQILSGKAREEIVEATHEYLRKVAADLRTGGKVPVDKFVITKGISKNPEEYTDIKSQPHVRVALRNKERGKKVKPGDHIAYVVCKGESPSTPVADRAFSPEEVKHSNGQLVVDVDWYLTQQIHPPVLRLCETIEGIDAASIAHNLGMDESRYAHATHSDVGALRTSDSSSEVEFQDVERLVLTCCNQACRRQSAIESWKTNSSTLELSCPECHALMQPKSLANQVTMAARRQIDRYYEGASICRECNNRSRQLHLKGAVPRAKCLVPGCKGSVRPEVTEKQLWLQLKYLRHLFAAHAAGNRPYHLAFQQAQSFLNSSQFNQVDLTSLFSCFRVSPSPAAPAPAAFSRP